MTKVAHLMVALATAGSVIALGTTSADAQRRNRNQEAAPAAPATPTVSRPFSVAYQPLQVAMAASNWAAADAALPAVKAAAVSEYEKFVTAQSEFRIAVGLQDLARQSVAVTAMIDSNGAPAADAARIYVAGGQQAYNAQNFAVAAQRVKRAIELGSTTDGLATLLIDSYFRGGQIDEGLAEGRSQIAAAQAAGRKAPEQIYSLMARELQEADRNEELLDVLAQRVDAYPTPGNFRTASLIYLQTSPEDRGLSIDVLRLMSAAEAMSDRRFYVEYVSSLAEDALPNEALEAIAAGRAATLIPAGDATFGEIETTARANLNEDRASLPGGERRAAASPEARLATRIADAYLSYGNHAKAEELYLAALGKTGADTALVNTRLGITRYRAGNMAGALEAFGQVQGMRTMAARLWTALIRSKMAAAAPPPAAAATPTPPPAG
jgi:hypothetical protein